MAKITRSANAVWTGGGTDGRGSLTTASGALSGVAYSAGMRFSDVQGTNPEELIAAAHAGCFSMALAFALTGAGHPPDELRASARATIEKMEAGWRFVAIALEVVGRVPGMSREDFIKHAEAAKAGCPVSNVLKADITLKADLA
jgi:osmotically inducible protein OsmC